MLNRLEQEKTTLNPKAHSIDVLWHIKVQGT